MAECIVVTWTMIHGRVDQHEESIKRNMDYWRKNARRFKLKSMRYFAQARAQTIYYYFEYLANEMKKRDQRQ